MSRLPVDLRYLEKPAGQCVLAYGPADLDRLIDEMTEDDRQELSRVYRRLCQGSDRDRLHEWWSAESERNKPGDLVDGVLHLLLLFDRLADRDVEPFCLSESRFVRFENTIGADQSPDWSDLPEDLHYVIPWAEKFGVYQTEAAICDRAEIVTDDELSGLAALQARLTKAGHDDRLVAWADSRTADRREAWLINYMYLFMDAVID